MSTRRPPTRWISIRRTRRNTQRRRAGYRRCAAAGYGHALDLGSEKTHIESRGDDRHDVRSRPRASRPSQPLPAFVEFVPPLLPGSAPQWTIEIEEPDGRKMIISVQGIPQANLLALLHGLRNATP